jgi:cytochrome P450
MQPSLFRYKIDRLLLMPHRKRLIQMSIWLSKLASERVDLGKDTENKDLFHLMIDAVDPKTGNQYTRKDMWIESVLMITGGECAHAVCIS